MKKFEANKQNLLLRYQIKIKLGTKRCTNLSKILSKRTLLKAYKQEDPKYIYNETRMNPGFKLGPSLDDHSTVPCVFTCVYDRSCKGSNPLASALKEQDLVFPREREPILKRGHKLLIPARGRQRVEESINRIDAAAIVMAGGYLDFTASWWPRNHDSRVKWHRSRDRLLVTDY